MLNYLFGLKTDNFVILAADTMAFDQIWNISRDDNKFYNISSSTSIVGVGESGDMDTFGEYVAKNMALYELRNGYELSPKAVANFARREIVTNLRSADAYAVHLIVGGYDRLASQPHLCLIDYLGTSFSNNYVMFGYGAFFCYSILDRLYRKDMTVESAMDLMSTCFAEVKKRLIIDVGELKVQVIDANGKRDMPNLKMAA